MSKQEGLRRYPHPGKFEGELLMTSWLYGFEVDEEIGAADELGWYGLIRFETRDDRKEFADQMNVSAHDQDGDQLTPEEHTKIMDTSAIIVSENDQGFFSATYYTSLKLALRDFESTQQEYEEIEEGQGEEGA